jgi:hypothetical protein
MPVFFVLLEKCNKGCPVPIAEAALHFVARHKPGSARPFYPSYE